MYFTGIFASALVATASAATIQVNKHPLLPRRLIYLLPITYISPLTQEPAPAPATGLGPLSPPVRRRHLYLRDGAVQAIPGENRALHWPGPGRQRRADQLLRHGLRVRGVPGRHEGVPGVLLGRQEGRRRRRPRPVPVPGPEVGERRYGVVQPDCVFWAEPKHLLLL